MRRRELLGSVSLLLTGCVGRGSEGLGSSPTAATAESESEATEGGSTSTSAQLNTGTEVSAESEAPPTVQPPTETPEFEVVESLNFGEWYEDGDWAFTVTDWRKQDWFEDENAGKLHPDRTPKGKVEMPNGRALILVALEAKNLRRGPATGTPYGFSVIRGRNIYESIDGFEHPQYSVNDGVVNMDWLRGYEGRERAKIGSLLETESGGRLNLWFGTIVPATTNLDDYEAMYSLGRRLYPPGGFKQIRWES